MYIINYHSVKTAQGAIKASESGWVIDRNRGRVNDFVNEMLFDTKKEAEVYLSMLRLMGWAE